MNAKQIKVRAELNRRAKAERDAEAKRDPRRHDHTLNIRLGRDGSHARAVLAQCLTCLDTLPASERDNVLRAIEGYYWRPEDDDKGAAGG